MRFEARVMGQAKVPTDECITVREQSVNGEDYSNQKLQKFAAIGSRFNSCRFNNISIEDASFGSGKAQSEYVACSFNGARLNMSAGGNARFIKCVFEDVDLRNWICFGVELIECTFSGRLTRAIFNGTVPLDKRPLFMRERNEITRNNFSRLTMEDVVFRSGVNLLEQVLPSDSEYLFISNASLAIKRARLDFRALDPDAEREGLAIFDALQRDATSGQEQMLLRARDYYTGTTLHRPVVDHVFALLSKATMNA